MAWEPEKDSSGRPGMVPDPLEDSRRAGSFRRSLALAALLATPALLLAPKLISHLKMGEASVPQPALEAPREGGSAQVDSPEPGRELDSLRPAETPAPAAAKTPAPASLPDDIAPDQVDLNRGLDQALLGAAGAASSSPGAPASSRKLKSFEPGSSAEIKSWDRPDEGPATTTAFYSLPPGMPESSKAEAAGTPAAPAHCPPGKCAILVPYKPGIPLCPDGHWVNSIARTCCATRDFCQANAAEGICAMVQGGRVTFPKAQAPAPSPAGAKAPIRSPGRSTGRAPFPGSGHEGSRP